MSNWDLTNLHPHLSKVITENLKYDSPTDVQAEFFKILNKRCDVLLASKTGSGKTLCFLTAILNRAFIQFDKKGKEYLESDDMDALIILPSRELAIQVYKEFKKFLTEQYKSIKVSLIVGGFSKQKQLRTINDHSKIVIATPGRLWDLIDQEKVKRLWHLGGVKFLVLDEIDRIIELGQFKELKQVFDFIFKHALTKKADTDAEMPKIAPEDEFVEFEGQKVRIMDEFEFNHDPQLSPEEIEKIQKRMKNRRCFLVSATLTRISSTSRMMTNKRFSDKIKKLQKKNKGDEKINPKLIDAMSKIVLNHPMKVLDLTTDDQLMPAKLKIQKVKCLTDEKVHFLFHFLKSSPGLTIVFVNSINAAWKVNNILKNLNINSVCVSSKMRQVHRIQRLEDFQNSKKTVLITTDVASRGIDIPNVKLVIHYHMPRDFDTFIHRCGRTARADTEGLSILIADADDHKRFNSFVRDLGGSNVESIVISPSELYKSHDLVEKALKLERETFQLDKKEKNNSWIRKAAEEIGIDEFDDIQDVDEHKQVIKAKRNELKFAKKRHFAELIAHNTTATKKFSTFLSPMDVASINQSLKRVKK